MLGIALGAAVDSGLKAYDEGVETAIKNLQRQQLQKQLEQEKSFEDALAALKAGQYEGGTAVGELVPQAIDAKKLGLNEEQVGQLQKDFAQFTPEQAQGALRHLGSKGLANEGYSGALKGIGVYKDPETGKILATSDYKPRSGADMYSELYKQMQSAGNTYGIEKAMGLYNSTREMEMTIKFDEWRDELNNDMMELQKVGEAKGLSGVPEVMNPLLKDYGVKTKFVEGKNGVGQLEITTDDGTTMRVSSVREAQKALVRGGNQFMMQELMQFVDSPEQAVDFITKQQDIWAQKQQVRQGDEQIAISRANLALNKRNTDSMIEARDAKNDREEVLHKERGAVVRYDPEKEMYFQYFPHTGEKLYLPGIDPSAVKTEEDLINLAKAELDLAMTESELYFMQRNGGLTPEQYRDAIADEVDVIAQSAEGVNLTAPQMYQMAAQNIRARYGLNGGSAEVGSDTVTGRALEERGDPDVYSGAVSSKKQKSAIPTSSQKPPPDKPSRRGAGADSQVRFTPPEVDGPALSGRGASEKAKEKRAKEVANSISIEDARLAVEQLGRLEEQAIRIKEEKKGASIQNKRRLDKDLQRVNQEIDRIEEFLSAARR